jgi:eukaryotic-like serine/threonine-protein kinase
VAVKILPPAFTSDPGRLERFEREARALASLNHVNIGSIYGIEESGAVRALVLELVEGETLAERLRTRGALPADEASALARQIADALDAAHERGIVHRDLKPANIKIDLGGTVKVLDFGLAKALDQPDVHGSLAATATGTNAGIILGTVAYMSPEQARGQAVDKRTDIWAFGCVLYEMLTGRAAFDAPTISDTIAKVLGTPPDWAAVPGGTPPGIVRLLKRCLEPDLRRRLRDLGDVDLALDGTMPATTAPAAPEGRIWKWVAAAALGLAAVAGALAFAPRAPLPPDNAPPVRFEANLPLAQSGTAAVAPDGRRIAFIGVSGDGSPRLWIRSLDAVESRSVSGSEGAVGFNTTIFWSPDSRSIGFYADGRVMRIDSAGGAPQLVCNAQGVLVGGSWNADGVIVMGNTAGGVVRCPAAGGEPVIVTATANPSELHVFPRFLPDGRHLLYLRISRADPSVNGVYVADVEQAPGNQPSMRVLETGFGVEYVPVDDTSGRVLFVRDQTLFAVPFDAVQRRVTGEPVQLATPVGSFRDGVFFSASRDLLVYRGQLPPVQMEWRSRSGALLQRVGEAGAYGGIALSPDASRVAVLRETRLSRADQDIWIHDLGRDTFTRMTTDPQLESMPAWSQNGTLIFAVGHGAADVWAHPITGGAGRQVLSRADHPEFRVNPLLTTMNASADGTLLVYTVEAVGRTQSDLWILSLGDGTVAPLVQQDFSQTQGAISPDGRWLAYVSNESGVNDIFVRPLVRDAATVFPRTEAAIIVSRGGGTAPRWRGDSRELFYQTGAGRIMAAAVSQSDVGPPVELFQAPGSLPHWGITADGQRLLLARPSGPQQVPLTFVTNWQVSLDR